MPATLTLLVPGLAVPTMTKVFVDDVLIGQNGDWVDRAARPGAAVQPPHLL